MALMIVATGSGSVAAVETILQSSGLDHHLVGEGVYLIRSRALARDWRDKIAAMTGRNAQILVLELAPRWATFGLSEAAVWLQKDAGK